MVKSYEKQAKSKADIAKEKSLVTKQHIKEKEKASTKKEKKDLDATQKRESKHPIHKKKGKGIELKEKSKVKIKPKSKKDISTQKSKEALERKRAGIKVSTPKKHPAHHPSKGGGIHKDKPPKGKYEKKPGTAQAAEPNIVPKKKPLSPEQKKKDKAIMKAEKARREKAKAKAKSAPIMKAEKKRRAEAKKDMPTGRSAAASGAAKGKDIAMQRKKHVLGTLKDKPSGKK